MTGTQIIPTEQLRVDHLPLGSDWPAIARFAMTFDPQESSPNYAEASRDIHNASDRSSVIELRMHLYFEWRRCAHVGGPPTPETLGRLVNAIQWIRAQLQ